MSDRVRAAFPSAQMLYSQQTSELSVNADAQLKPWAEPASAPLPASKGHLEGKFFRIKKKKKTKTLSFF